MIKHDNSRQQQILNLLLDAKAGLSIDELATALNISRTAVKQHLVSLEKLSLVQESALNIDTGGRPARCYTLTTQGINSFPKQYSWFAKLLLDELFALLPEQSLDVTMQELGKKLAYTLAPQFSHHSPDAKVKAVLALMQQLGYKASIDETAKETIILATNCVYHDLAQQYPEICHFDQALIATLLQQPIEQTHCMAKQDCQCRFRLLKSV